MKLIDADALRHEIHCAYSDDLDILDHIDAQPTVDAVPVVHGRWIPCNSKYGHDEKVYLCDQCNNNVGFTKMNFCPNCGADMREDGGDD